MKRMLICLATTAAIAAPVAAQDEPFGSANSVADSVLDQVDVTAGNGNNYNVVGIDSVAEQTITGETNVTIDTGGGDITPGGISITGTLGANGVGNYMVNTGVGNTLGQAINLNLILYGAVPAGAP